MTITPPLGEFPRYPVTVALGVSSALVSLAWWLGGDIDWAFMSSAAIGREPWRLLSSMLPHVNVIHLGFNLLWLWSLGARVEAVLGHARFTGLVVLLGVVSSMGEFGISEGGVGLSGVVYGFAAFAYALRAREPRFAEVMTRQTVQLFVVWFFVCIALTITKVMPIGNMAHGAGAALGWTIGRACLRTGKARQAWVGAACGLGLAAFALAMVGRPLLADPAILREQAAYEGYRALERGQYQRAVDQLEVAVMGPDADAGSYANLGIALQHLERHVEALNAYRRAATLDPSLLPRISPAMNAILLNEAHAAAERGELDLAVKDVDEAMTLVPADLDTWRFVGALYERREQWDLAREAYEAALALAPSDPYSLEGIARLNERAKSGP